MMHICIWLGLFLLSIAYGGSATPHGLGTSEIHAKTPQRDLEYDLNAPQQKKKKCDEEECERCLRSGCWYLLLDGGVVSCQFPPFSGIIIKRKPPTGRCPRITPTKPPIPTTTDTPIPTTIATPIPTTSSTPSPETTPTPEPWKNDPPEDISRPHVTATTTLSFIGEKILIPNQPVPEWIKFPLPLNFPTQLLNQTEVTNQDAPSQGTYVPTTPSPPESNLTTHTELPQWTNISSTPTTKGPTTTISIRRSVNNDSLVANYAWASNTGTITISLCFGILMNFVA